MDRRTFLKNAAVLTTTPMWSSACGDDEALAVYEWNGPLGPQTIFSHGVASGDPLPDGVIVWTRVSDLAGFADVFVEVATDEAFERRVVAQWTRTSEDDDFTVKVDVRGLSSATVYHYRFWAQGRVSPVGRTRTTAARGTPAVRFGVASCSNYQRGFFHAYRALAQRDDLDAVMHLGDYIYETAGEAEVPGHDPIPAFECHTLGDYRLRYASYRRDPDLQAVHARHPFIHVWDDHETANDAWAGGADAHGDGEGSWEIRKAAATRAFLEWLPVREQQGYQIFRGLSFGATVDLHMLDTRLWGRTKQTIDVAVARSESPDLLGADQEAWLFDRLERSSATWNLLGQQVMMGQLKLRGGLEADGGGAFVNLDQWDGYQRSRERLLNHASQMKTRLVVFTGDIHSSWANDLTLDPNNPQAYDRATGRGSVGVEFVAPAVTSPGLDGFPESVFQRLLGENPHVQWVDAVKNGFFVATFEADGLEVEFHHVNDIKDPGSAVVPGPAFRVETTLPLHVSPR